MKALKGSIIYELSKNGLNALIGEKSPVCVDMGTGTGRFPLAGARRDPAGFYIGLDPVPENMRENSLKAAKSVKKGGVPNLLYAVCSAEDIPPELGRLADAVTVNLPWGSLRDGIVLGGENILKNLRSLGKTGAELTVLVGYDENNEPAEMERRGLPPLSEQLFSEISGNYLGAGIKIISVSVLDNMALRKIESDWARRLAYGPPRQTFRLVGEYI